MHHPGPAPPARPVPNPPLRQAGRASIAGRGARRPPPLPLPPSPAAGRTPHWLRPPWGRWRGAGAALRPPGWAWRRPWASEARARRLRPRLRWGRPVLSSSHGFSAGAVQGLQARYAEWRLSCALQARCAPEPGGATPAGETAADKTKRQNDKTKEDSNTGAHPSREGPRRRRPLGCAPAPLVAAGRGGPRPSRRWPPSTPRWGAGQRAPSGPWWRTCTAPGGGGRV
jgi:hypothetical protein